MQNLEDFTSQCSYTQGRTEMSTVISQTPVKETGGCTPLHYLYLIFYNYIKLA